MVLSEILDLRRPTKNISPIEVSIRYRILNGENLTIKDGLRDQHIQLSLKITSHNVFELLWENN